MRGVSFVIRSSFLLIGIPLLRFRSIPAYNFNLEMFTTSGFCEQKEHICRLSKVSKSHFRKICSYGSFALHGRFDYHHFPHSLSSFPLSSFSPSPLNAVVSPNPPRSFSLPLTSFSPPSPSLFLLPFPHSSVRSIFQLLFHVFFFLRKPHSRHKLYINQSVDYTQYLCVFCLNTLTQILLTHTFTDDI